MSESSSPEDSPRDDPNLPNAKQSKAESPRAKSPRDSDSGSDSESSKLSNTRSDSSQPAEKLKNVSYEWRTFKMPTVPPPDDSQIETELNQHYDITTLFQQMRSVS